MDSFTLLELAAKGQIDEEQRLPFSFWKHFPKIDRKPNENAKAHIKFQRMYQCDLIKVSPHGRFPVVDFGCVIGPETDPVTGSTRCSRHAVNSLDDWEKIVEIDPLEGELGNCLQLVKLISKEFHQEKPVIMTVFLPLMTTDKLSNDLNQYLIDDEQLVIEKLHIITKTIKEYCKAALDEGADGLFFATQQASADFWLREDLEKFKYFDEKILNEFKHKSKFNILHVHGNNIFFDWASDQPTSFINWHSTETLPTMKEAVTPQAIMNGLDNNVFVKFSTYQIKAYLSEYIGSLLENRKKSVISPGCVLDLNNNPENLQAISNYFLK
jgi:uroporphyrinogen decarboxylase